jgi:amidase
MRWLLLLTLIFVPAPAIAKPADPTGLTATEIAAKLNDRSLTSVSLTRALLDRIAALNRTGPRLNAVIAVNPDAMTQAAALDAERRAGKVRGTLHGVPVLIKDNIETLDAMATTAGSLALKDNRTGRDSPLVARLRAAGAIILGKTNLSEWANIRSSRSMSGWSAIGGIVRNPYALDRTACGSSSGSGSAVAARLAPLAVGTETDGSIVCPSSINGLVGIKPTVGLISRTHVIPISASQDTPGPMTRSVRDAAVMLGVMAGSDPADPATVEADARRSDYAAAITGDIKGVRIGVLRDQTGDQPGVAAAFESALARLRAKGAVLVDIADSKYDRAIGQNEGIVLYTELKAGMAAYLASTPPVVKVRTLADVIAFNKANAAAEMPYFAQETFEKAEGTKGVSDPAYLKAQADAKRLAGPAGIDRILKDANVAMLVQPTQGTPWFIDPVNGDQGGGPSASTPAAVAGYPHVTVPMGLVMGLPVGLSFTGPKWSEALLINAADAFERSGPPLPAPTYAPTVKAALDPQG